MSMETCHSPKCLGTSGHFRFFSGPVVEQINEVSEDPKRKKTSDEEHQPERH